MNDHVQNKLGRYFCEQCHGRFDALGDCPKCPGEPLLDLADEDVRIMLDEMDHSARTKRFATMAGIAAVISIPVFFLVPLTCNWLFAIPAAALSCGGIAIVLSKIFPARRSAPELTDSEIRFLERPDVS